MHIFLWLPNTSDLFVWTINITYLLFKNSQDYLPKIICQHFSRELSGQTTAVVLEKLCFPPQMKKVCSQKPKMRLGNSDLLIHSHLNRTCNIQDVTGSHTLKSKKQQQTILKPNTKWNKTANITTPEIYPHTKKKQRIGKVKLTFARS